MRLTQVGGGALGRLSLVDMSSGGQRAPMGSNGAPGPSKWGLTYDRVRALSCWEDEDDWLQVVGFILLTLTQGGPQGEPPAEAKTEETEAGGEARTARASGDPAATMEALGVPWGGSGRLLEPTKLQPSLVRVLGP